jgi:hypothetical protein
MRMLQQLPKSRHLPKPAIRSVVRASGPLPVSVQRFLPPGRHDRRIDMPVKSRPSVSAGREGINHREIVGAPGFAPTSRRVKSRGLAENVARAVMESLPYTIARRQVVKPDY